MRPLSRLSKIILAVVAVFVVGGVLVILGSQWTSARVPTEFKEARLQGALISQSIVDYSNSLSVELQKINDLEKQRKYQDAVAATDRVISQSQGLRDKAVDLSRQLEIMAQALPKISSADARQAALNSIASRLALISRLINYSGYLGDLLTTLRGKFAAAPHSQANIDAIVNQINLEVTAVNNFNKNAVASMDEFDKIINGQ